MKYLIFIFILCVSLNSWQSFQELTAENDYRSSALTQQDKFHGDSPSDLTDECSISCICSNFESAATDNILTLSRADKGVVLTDPTVGHSATDHYSRKHLDSVWQPPKSTL